MRYCRLHRERLHRYGHLEPPVRTPMERFLAKVEKTKTCWNWAGAKHATGYGMFFAEPGRIVRPHRWIYEQLVAPIPEGLSIDHLCRNRSCVNPDHLEPVTHQENCRRAHAAMTVCRRGGHPWVKENILVRPINGRLVNLCLTCTRKLEKRRNERAKAKRLAALAQ